MQIAPKLVFLAAAILGISRVQASPIFVNTYVMGTGTLGDDTKTLYTASSAATEVLLGTVVSSATPTVIIRLSTDPAPFTSLALSAGASASAETTSSEPTSAITAATSALTASGASDSAQFTSASASASAQTAQTSATSASESASTPSSLKGEGMYADGMYTARGATRLPVPTGNGEEEQQYYAQTRSA